MNIDSLREISSTRPVIPESAYRPVKRCPNCNSVYLTDEKCEACGRNLAYHPVGEPFGLQSLYGLKERFYNSLPFFVRCFPLLENKKDNRARSYVRFLNRRLHGLLSALANDAIVSPDHRRLFYVELMELMDELLRYGEPSVIIQRKIEDELGFKNMLLTPELLGYLHNSSSQVQGPGEHWSKAFLGYRLWGIFRLDTIIKVFILSTAVIAAAVSFYEIIRWQFGK